MGIRRQKAKKDNKNVIKDDKTNDVKTISSKQKKVNSTAHKVKTKTNNDKILTSYSPSVLTSDNSASKDSTLQVANGKNTVTKSVKQNEKSRNLARYQEILGE